MEDKLEAMQEQIAKARVWAEGTDAEVTALGGQHSSKTWAGIAKQAADQATGAAFPILADGDQGKALVVNDAADGYELTTITADAAEYSTNRIVRTAHEQQNWVLKEYRWSKQAYFKAGAVGWVPNGVDPDRPVDFEQGDFKGFLFTTCVSKNHCVVLNNIASDDTVTAVQDLPADDLPLRDYSNGTFYYVVSADGEEVVGFKYNEMAQGSLSEHFTAENTPSTYYYVVYCAEGKAYYTKDSGATWVQCSLPFARTCHSNSSIWAWTYGSVVSLPGRYVTSTQSGDKKPYSWLVPPFDCCIANGYSENTGYPGSPARLQAYRLKLTEPLALGTLAATNDTVGMLGITVDGEVAGGLKLRFFDAAGSRYDLGTNRVNGEDMAICICRGQSQNAWDLSGTDFSEGYRPPFGEPPSFFKVARGTDCPDAALVRVFPTYVNDIMFNALNGCASGSIAMRNSNNTLEVFSRNNGGFAYDAPSDFEGAGSTRWTNISPAAPGASNTFTATNTFKSWTYFEGETYVRNGGYMQAQGASYFLVPDFSRAEDSDEARYEAVNRKTLQDNLATREPVNTGVSLSTPSSSPFAGKVSVVGSATLDDATGIATGFGTGSYLKLEATALDGYGYDMIFRVMQNGASGRGAILSWDSSDGNIANTEAGLQDTTPYTFQNTQTLCTVSPTLAANAWNWVRFKKGGSGVDVYVLADPTGQYTLDTLPALDSWVHSDATGYLELPPAGRTLYIGRSFVDSSYYLHGSIDMYNVRITLGDTLWYDGAALAPKSYSTVGTHQQSTGRIADSVVLRRFEADGKTYMELDGMFTGTVAADNTISVGTSAYGFKGTLISLQATPLGTGSVTVNYNSTTAADMENGTITLRTSVTAGETFGISLHCVIEQTA